MYRYIKHKDNFNKQFEEPHTKEYDTGVTVVYNASNEEFQQLLELQNKGKEITQKEFSKIAHESDQMKHELSRLQVVFSKKTTGLKKLGIGKAWMSDERAINDQYRIYEEMYKNAKNNLYDKKTNAAIIKANEYSKKSLASFTLLLNTLRGVLENMIISGDVKSDETLMMADSISLSKDDLTPKKLNEIKKAFGL